MYLVASTERGIPSSALSGVLEVITEQENVHIIPGVQIFPDLYTGIKITFILFSQLCWRAIQSLLILLVCTYVRTVAV